MVLPELVPMLLVSLLPELLPVLVVSYGPAFVRLALERPRGAAVVEQVSVPERQRVPGL